jgi:outer membrane protein, multidrug efflux system
MRTERFLKLYAIKRKGIIKMRPSMLSAIFHLTFWALIPAFLGLTGCTVGPDYVRPGVNAPAAFMYNDKEALETANTLWWKQFQDPALDALIAEALTHNKSVMIAAANIEKASAVLMQIRSPLFPQIAYSGSGANQRASESNTVLADFADNPRTAYQAMSGASWEIDLWGRVRRLSEAAQADLFASEEARRGVILSLVGSVAGSYIQLLGLDEQLAVAKRSLAAYGESVKLFENQFQHGQVSQMTVEQARTQYETAAAEIPDIELQIAQTENTLSILLGRNPGHVPRFKTIHEIKLPAVPKGIPSDILANRPDIRQAEQNLIAANAQIGAATALYFPSISLTGNFGYASTELSDLFQGSSRVWSYGGSLTGPVFTAGAISGQVKAAEAVRDAALLNYELSIQSAFSDVENALVARQKISEKIQAQEHLVKACNEYVRLARIQYHSGYAPYSTVLQAEQQLFPAELKYAQTRASLFASLSQIYLATGGGWVAGADRMTGLHKNDLP